MSTAAAVPAALHLHVDDNVCIATRGIEPGERVVAGQCDVTSRARVPLGHKLAVVAIAQGEAVRKYGQTIGFATRDIAVGEWVHTHNLAAGEFERDYRYSSEVPPAPAPITGRTFRGYRRADGKVGTRNYVAIISTVNCSASVGRYVADRITPEILASYPHVDGVIAITHKTGCGMAWESADHRQLNRVLAGIARHPNVGGYILIGLGCETGSVRHLIDSQGLVQISGVSAPLPESRVLNIQDVGGTEKTVAAGVEAVMDLLPSVNDVEREEVPASHIVLGLECGGSDGNSGVTANPALGVASDMLVAAGGTAVLSETPEIYGAEHLLTRRAVSEAVGRKLVDRIHWWERYAAKHDVVIDNNPSPGNKEGGLTTIYEKSLGAVAKGGTTALCDVYEYAEPVTAKGLVVMDTPGYDPASVTGMVAGGANVVCFTTGRGSCFGCKPTPSIKIATNTPMYERMTGDMDINAGRILGGTSLDEVGEEIFEMILRVASGEQTKSERHGIGEEEFAPWMIGATL
ncbi:MAG: altronate dehydratase family protein [Pirellulales bacterium]